MCAYNRRRAPFQGGRWPAYLPALLLPTDVSHQYKSSLHESVGRRRLRRRYLSEGPETVKLDWSCENALIRYMTVAQIGTCFGQCFHSMSRNPRLALCVALVSTMDDALGESGMAKMGIGTDGTQTNERPSSLSLPLARKMINSLLAGRTEAHTSEAIL